MFLLMPQIFFGKEAAMNTYKNMYTFIVISLVIFFS